MSTTSASSNGMRTEGVAHGPSDFVPALWFDQLGEAFGGGVG